MSGSVIKVTVLGVDSAPDGPYSRTGNTEYLGGNMTTKTCKISGCRNRHDSRGWCKKHYQNWLRYGDPIAPRKRAPGRSYPTAAKAVEESTEEHGDCLIWTGGVMNGYPIATVAGTQVYLTRSVYGESRAEVPKGLIIRRTCKNKLCLNYKHMQIVRRGNHLRSRPIDGKTYDPWLDRLDHLDETTYTNPGYLPPEQ